MPLSSHSRGLTLGEVPEDCNEVSKGAPIFKQEGPKWAIDRSLESLSQGEDVNQI